MKNFQTPCEVRLLTSYSHHKRSWILTNKNILPKLIEDISPGQTDLEWIWFIYPETIVDEKLVNYIFRSLLDNFNQIKNQNLNNKNYMIASKITDKEPTIIHHYAGHNKEDLHKLSFFNAAKGFICSRELLFSLYNYLISDESDYFTSSSRFFIDYAHELSELLDKATNSERDWLVNDAVISKIEVETFEDRELQLDKAMISEKYDIFTAVKSSSIFKKDRWPIIFDTWMHPNYRFENVKIYSDKKDTFRNFEISDSFGIPNTKSGHCGKSDIIIRNFDHESFKFLIILDDDTIIGKEKLLKLLSQYNHKIPMVIGQRYGFNLQNNLGYNYITGGGGMIFTSAAVKLYKQSGCKCPDLTSPDDMIISNCIEHNNGFIVHEPSIHQARPMDYTEGYLESHKAVSFHKFWNCDGREIYKKWFGNQNMKKERDELFTKMLNLSKCRHIRNLPSVKTKFPTSKLSRAMTKVPFVPKNNSTTNENSLLFSKIDEILDHESLEIKENVSDNRIGGKLSEFFYPPEYYDEMHMNSVFQIRAGDEWPIQVLRALDVAELQELWFVLLVERNRLFAARFEYLRNQITLPSMQRLDNIAKSMDNLRTVLEQTEKAKNMLYKGRSEEITGEYNTNSFGDAEWVRHREHPVPKEGQYEHLQKYVFETTHPDAKIPHHNVREFQLRQEEQKYMEMNEFYKNLRQKWNSYRNARPEDKTLSEEPPEWWLGMKENQPKFRNDMWITNMPLVSDEYKEKKKISVNVPGDPNI